MCSDSVANVHVNRTKIKGGCLMVTKVSQLISNNQLPLALAGNAAFDKSDTATARCCMLFTIIYLHTAELIH